MSLNTGVEPIASGKTIVHLDVDPWEIGKNFPAEAALLGDPKTTLPELAAEVRAHMTTEARTAAEARVADITARNGRRRTAIVAKAESLSDAQPIQPMALLRAIGQALPTNAVVVEEILSSNPGLRDLILSDDPQSYYGLRGGGIGMALPQALGAQLGMPDRPVVALVGDGSALYTIQSLWTAAHERLNVIFVVFNNRSYRILKQRTKALDDHAKRTDRYVAMDLTDPSLDYLALARGMGIEAVGATTVQEAIDALSSGLADPRPLLIDVAIDSRL
jgi:benzoylformate decarboxylase